MDAFDEERCSGQETNTFDLLVNLWLVRSFQSCTFSIAVLLRRLYGRMYVASMKFLSGFFDVG